MRETQWNSIGYGRSAYRKSALIESQRINSGRLPRGIREPENLYQHGCRTGIDCATIGQAMVI